jgi:hypothetical protein
VRRVPSVQTESRTEADSERRMARRSSLLNRWDRGQRDTTESEGELYLLRALFEDLFGEVVADLRVVAKHFVVGETEHLGVTLA